MEVTDSKHPGGDDAAARSPRIGIPVPTSGNAEYSGRSWPNYATAVEQAGGTPVKLDLTLSPKELARIASECSGFVLPGSPADVDPLRYGQEADPATAAADPAREECDRILLEHAEGSGKPVLAICYGVQSLNVWRGGTLVQDIHPLPVNHRAGKSVAVAHSVLISSASLLGSLLPASEAPAEGAFRRLPVNSSHHQAVAVPGEDLSIVARSTEDGVIEGVEGRIGLSAMVGVQWHPERGTDASGASRALFLWLVSEAADSAGPAGDQTDAYAF